MYKFQWYIILILLLHLASAKSSTDGTKKQYIVENNACRLQRQDPWLLKRYYFKKTYIPCRQKKPFTVFKRVNGSIYAVLDPYRINLYRRRSVDVTCCISNVTRVVSASVPDNTTQETRCILFDGDGKAEVKSPIVKIRCLKVDNNRSVQAYENVYGFHLPESVTRDANFTKSSAAFNVLMIGISSMSRQSVVRAWPKTDSYLKRAGWLNFEGYSQVGERKSSNLLSVLSGYSEQQTEKAFRSQWGDFYDNYDFIWNDYQNRGYVTSFAEDHSQYAIFNHLRNGFITPPTDFYFRPYTVASDKLQTSTLDRMPHCIGNQNAAERILDLAVDYVKTFGSIPYFGLFWLNTFSVEDFNAPCRMDEKMREFFKRLEPYINSTFIAFFSDHGFDNHNITRLRAAWLESRQPFLYIYVPDKFRLRFSKEYEKAKENTERLTSPYDLYVTLHDILKLSGTEHEVAYASGCRKCNSLLKSIPDVRSCSDAGVDEEFCLCANDVVVPSNMTYLKAYKGNGNLKKKMNIVALIVFAMVCNVIIEKII